MLKVRKKLVTYGILVIFAVLLTACNSTADAVVDYNNEFIMQEFYSKEQDYLNKVEEYQKLIEETDDQTKRKNFLEEEVLPRSQKLLDLTKNNQFENEEIQEVHNLLLESEELRHQSLEMELEAIESGSQETIEEAKEITNEVEEKKQEFISKMDALIEEYDLEEQEK